MTSILKVLKQIQLNPALTDFKGPTNFICYKRNSVIANVRNKKKTIEGTFVSITGGIPLVAGLLERGSAVVYGITDQLETRNLSFNLQSKRVYSISYYGNTPQVTTPLNGS